MKHIPDDLPNAWPLRYNSILFQIPCTISYIFVIVNWLNSRLLSLLRQLFVRLLVEMSNIRLNMIRNTPTNPKLGKILIDSSHTILPYMHALNDMNPQKCNNSWIVLVARNTGRAPYMSIANPKLGLLYDYEQSSQMINFKGTYICMVTHYYKSTRERSRWMFKLIGDVMLWVGASNYSCIIEPCTLALDTNGPRTPTKYRTMDTIDRLHDLHPQVHNLVAATIFSLLVSVFVCWKTR